MNKLIIVFLILAAVYIGWWYGLGNQKLTYGDTGYPKNCRAIITENIEGYNSGQFTPKEALDSIDRNCGRYGISWFNR